MFSLSPCGGGKTAFCIFKERVFIILQVTLEVSKTNKLFRHRERPSPLLTLPRRHCKPKGKQPKGQQE